MISIIDLASKNDYSEIHIMLSSNQLIHKTAEYVKQKMLHESTGHDWWHVFRVWNMAKLLSTSYSEADLLKVELAALLHDLGDYKITGSSDAEEGILRSAMDELGFTPEFKEEVLEIIDKISYSKNVGSSEVLSIEAQIVQDADRLDALGALGIARVFATSGKAGRSIYDPTQTIQNYKTMGERRISNSSAILHFDEKLLVLRDMLNTKEAKKIGKKRHQYMLNYLLEFYAEWSGKD